MLEICIHLKIAHRNFKVLLLKERQKNVQSFCRISIEEGVSILWYIHIEPSCLPGVIHLIAWGRNILRILVKCFLMFLLVHTQI